MSERYSRFTHVETVHCVGMTTPRSPPPQPPASLSQGLQTLSPPGGKLVQPRAVGVKQLDRGSNRLLKDSRALEAAYAAATILLCPALRQELLWFSRLAGIGWSTSTHAGLPHMPPM